MYAADGEEEGRRRKRGGGRAHAYHDDGRGERQVYDAMGCCPAAGGRRMGRQEHLARGRRDHMEGEERREEEEMQRGSSGRIDSESVENEEHFEDVTSTAQEGPSSLHAAGGHLYFTRSCRRAVEHRRPRSQAQAQLLVVI